jgi:hypothetical protein
LLKCRVAHYFDLIFLIKLTRSILFWFILGGGRESHPALLWS